MRFEIEIEEKADHLTATFISDGDLATYITSLSLTEPGLRGYWYPDVARKMVVRKFFTAVSQVMNEKFAEQSKAPTP